jgi:Lipocalin-like domain
MKEFIKDKIIGTWKLVSWTFKNEQGETIHYLGEGATGILMYDSHGNMNAQLMKGERHHFASDAINGGSKEETYNAFNSYLAYWGKYYEDEPGAVVHIVEGSLFPNWLGNKEVRYGEIHGDKLILHTPPIPTGSTEIVFYITWKREL